MAEYALEFFKPAIEAAGKWFSAIIIRQFKYLCCFSNNIATLKDEAEKLDDTTKGLQGRVDREIDNVQVIVPEVETWIKKSNHIKDEMNGILNEVPNVESGCLKLCARFCLSKRAMQTSEGMIKLRDECKFGIISNSQPPAARNPVPIGTTYGFESRTQIEETIMTSLRDGDVNLIGIYGMGGLGKTTMARRIMNRALEERVFAEVVLARVSRTVDEWKIQVEIGGPLGLKDLKEEESMANRVQTLHKRLTQGTKRILIVLDDIWQSLEVEELGIPRGCKYCKILLTSRDHDVLRAMDVQEENIFGMEVLTKEEAWFLFKETAGTCVDDARLHSTVEKVVEECKGLPIALSIVGAALKDKDKRIWKDAVRQLRKANPTTIHNFIEKVYNPLKVSYLMLDSEEAKSILLLCCLFGEDAEIPLDYLTYMCMGLGIFEGSMKEARNWMYTLTNMLRSRSVLLDGDTEDFVRMHDVVRDVGIYIAKTEGYIDRNDHTWISSFKLSSGQLGLRFPNSRLLYLNMNNSNLDAEEEIELKNCFVEEIKHLRVLFIENYPYPSLISLPNTRESLRNLNTLVLDSCWRLETISVVGELVNVKILICRYCRSIKELPQKIKELKHLILLDLTGCEGLERIDRGIISSLVRLEELNMLRSFYKWEGWDSNQERENGNASLRELEALTNLSCLEIQMGPRLAGQKMRLSSKLKRFHIHICPRPYSFGQTYSFYFSSNKKMSLEWKRETCVGEWIVTQLLRDTESLCLSENAVNNVYYLAKSENIRWLRLEKCSTMKNIRGTSDTPDAPVFPIIEHLELRSLPQLEEILDGPISSNSFENLRELNLENLPALKQLWKSTSSSPVLPKLKEINLRDLPKLATFEFSIEAVSSLRIRHCHRLRNLGQLLSARKDYLSQLETLEIWSCKMMEQVFLWLHNQEEERNITKISFPKLKDVDLGNLPNLVTLCKGIGSIEFPLLMEMSIKECPKMKSMISSEDNNCGGSRNADIDYNHCPRLSSQQEKVVSFDSLTILNMEGNAFYCRKILVSVCNVLEKLTISKYEGSASLFSSSIARNFVNLRELSLEDCDEMVEVVKDEEEEEPVIGDERTLLFPKLEKLKLTDLYELESFCGRNCYVNCKRVKITSCSNMKIFNLGSNVLFPFHGLEELTIRNCEGSSLFSSSIARNLVNLKQLIIYCNDDMVKVIEDEKDEESVVSSGAAQTTKTRLFPKLQFLEMGSFETLESFCEWKCDIELPSLREVEISRCFNMKYFTRGHLSTPNLISVEINTEKFDGEKDLNGAVQREFQEREAYIRSCEGESETGKTEEEEEEGTNGEIVEEQNWKTATAAEEGEGRKGEIEEE